MRFGDCLGADSGSRSESSRWNGVLNCAPVYVEDICATANAARLAISNAGAAWSISSPTPRTGALAPVLVKKLHFAFKYGLLMVSLAGSGVDGIVLALAQEAAVRAARAGVHRTNQHEV